MAYRFKRGDTTLDEGVRRIAGEQIASMLRTIDASSTDVDHAVHQLRKSCKKVRGLLRLVRPAFSAYREENAAFRDIAASVSVVRDAAVLTASYDALMEHLDDQVERQHLVPLRRELTGRSQRLGSTGDLGELLEQARPSLLEAARRVAYWTLDGEGFPCLEDGLRETYRRARKAMRKAQQHPSPAQFHQWRKQCKYHGFHARLLQPVWPGPMKAYAACADELADLLGKHHDLAVFRHTITEAPAAFGEPADIEAVAGLVERRQGVLETQSFALGKRLFAPSPKAMVHAWGKRYAAWCSE